MIDAIKLELRLPSIWGEQGTTKDSQTKAKWEVSLLYMYSEWLELRNIIIKLGQKWKLALGLEKVAESLLFHLPSPLTIAIPQHQIQCIFISLWIVRDYNSWKNCK